MSMYSAKSLSDKIRMKKSSAKCCEAFPDCEHNMSDPSEAYNEERGDQVEETIDSPEKSEAPSAPVDADVSGTSQEESVLKKRMRLTKTFAKLR